MASASHPSQSIPRRKRNRAVTVDQPVPDEAMPDAATIGTYLARLGLETEPPTVEALSRQRSRR